MAAGSTASESAHEQPRVCCGDVPSRAARGEARPIGLLQAGRARADVGWPGGRRRRGYRSWLRFRNSFVFTTRPPRDAAPSCRSCPSRPQGRRHMCQCARSAGSRWVPQSKRSLHCSARSHCGAAPRRRSMSGLQGQRFSAARGLRHGPGRPHRAPEAAGVASLMTCATRRRGQLRFHNAPHFWHPPASRA